MTNQPHRKRYQKRVAALLAGITVGIILIAFPAMIHIIMGPTSPFLRAFLDPQIFGTEIITSPLDLLIEILILVLPAIFLIFALYWIVHRRTRWAGYDEAVKWSRR